MTRRTVATALLAGALAATGCHSPGKDAEESRARAASWAATSQELAVALRAGLVPRRFAEDAIRTSGDALAEESEKLRRLASRSPLAAGAVAPATRARDDTRALRPDAPDLAERAGRLGAAARSLRGGRPS